METGSITSSSPSHLVTASVFWGVVVFYLDTSLKPGLSCLHLKYNGARKGLSLKRYYGNTTGNCAMANFNFPDAIWETNASNNKLRPS